MKQDYHKRPRTPYLDVVRIVCVKKDKVLLVQESDDPNWKLPGGKIHENETVFEAVVREIQEELGLDVDESQIINYVVAPIPHSENERHIFLMGLGTENFVKTDEVEQTGFFDLSTLPETKFAGHIISAVDFVDK